jgi:hypothetical protein
MPLSPDWTALLLLGAYHGVNPSMGWLFAVALGLQHRDVRAVYRAIPPIALGHIGSVAIVLLIGAALQTVVPPEVVRFAAGVSLLALGLYKLRHHRHPRYGGMNVGCRDLAVWSFLMASAHGAGLMVLPFAIDVSMPMSATPLHHSVHGLELAGGTLARGLAATGAHVFSYFAVMSAIAWVVYRKLGLAILRTAWFDMDRIWAVALLVTGALIVVLG